MLQLHDHNPKSSPVIPPPNASTQNPSILEKTNAAYKLWHGFLIRFPRLSRYTLGTKIDTLFLDLLEYILEALYTSREKKGVLIQHASTTLDAIKFFLRVAWELKFLDHEKYALLTPPLVDIGNILGAWHKRIQPANSTKG